jgi:hypothetical protein
MGYPRVKHAMLRRQRELCRIVCSFRVAPVVVVVVVVVGSAPLSCIVIVSAC